MVIFANFSFLTLENDMVPPMGIPDKSVIYKSFFTIHELLHSRVTPILDQSSPPDLCCLPARTIRTLSVDQLR